MFHELSPDIEKPRIREAFSLVIVSTFVAALTLSDGAALVLFRPEKQYNVQLFHL